MFACVCIGTNCYNFLKEENIQRFLLWTVFSIISFSCYYLPFFSVFIVAYGNIIPSVYQGSCCAWKLAADSSQSLLWEESRALKLWNACSRRKNTYMFHFYHLSFPLLIKYRKRASEGWASWWPFGASAGLPPDRWIISHQTGGFFSSSTTELVNLSKNMWPTSQTWGSEQQGSYNHLRILCWKSLL